MTQTLSATVQVLGGNAVSDNRFFCERQGGWVAGPPDPPTVSIFLLGEVTLRQESFALGSARRAEEDGDGGGGGGGNAWGPSY